MVESAPRSWSGLTDLAGISRSKSEFPGVHEYEFRNELNSYSGSRVLMLRESYRPRCRAQEAGAVCPIIG